MLADLSALDPDDLPSFVGEVWERCGWEVARRPGRGDERTVVATRDSPVPQTHLVRVCGPGGIDDRAVREYAAADGRERADARILVTTGTPTARTRDLAADLDVKLVDGSDLTDLVVEHDAEDLLERYLDPADGAAHRGEELFGAERLSDGVEVLEAAPFEALERCPLCNSGRNNGTYFYPGTGRRTIEGGRIWSADLWNHADDTASRNLRCDVCAANWVEAAADRESVWKLDSAKRIRVGKREFVEPDDIPAATIEEWSRVDLDAGVLFPHPFDVPATEIESPPEPFDGWDDCPNCAAEETVFVTSIEGRSGRLLKCRHCAASWVERPRLLRANRWRLAGDGGGREATLAEWAEGPVESE